MNRKITFLVLFTICTFSFLQAQQLSNQDISKRIEEYKSLDRGPYKKIEWFCEDGTRRDSKDPCPDKIGGGIQHASYKDNLIEIQKKNHLFFSDILAYTEQGEFWDSRNNNSRIKQYQLNKYLQRIDDGWVNRRAQYYRGSVQSEDEEEWGIDFYNWLLWSDARIDANYFLIRESVKDIPHKSETQEGAIIRTLSKTIGDNYSRFMNIRTKIHNQPEKANIQLVKEFQDKNAEKLPEKIKKQTDSLIKVMTVYYQPIDINEFKANARVLPNGSYLRTKIEKFTEIHKDTIITSEFIEDASNLMCDIRTELTSIRSTSDRLAALDISTDLENLIFKTAPDWKPTTVAELLDKIYALSQASASAGFVEWWEWNEVDHLLQNSKNKALTLDELNQKLNVARSQVEWSAGMVNAIYGDDVETYAGFEPKANSFIDDRIRSSLALQLGNSVGELGNFIAEEANLSNKVEGVSNQSSIRGLNPGYALGELVVVKNAVDHYDVSPNKIYIFQRPPSDLKPVAGIATVTEGNLVSHVQLLARNLGIPNAVISNETIDDISKYHGEQMFYAVSNKGTVILKPADDMSNDEEELFEVKERDQEKIAVPTQKIDLSRTTPMDLSELNAASSGKYCGPKAANLGQLKQMFPDKVVNGSVIPFGIFKEHMNQDMPLQEGSYWDYLTETFAQASKMRAEDFSEEQVQLCTLDRMLQLREAIAKMPLKQSFLNDLEQSFQKNFNTSIGGTPVFLRSDTNMEDLDSFTGAGLNLTVFNVRDREKILKGIKDVWASPYTERSFKWRQQYLNNPENVYPSILIIPSVDVEYSGVLITKGISNNNEDDLTVAFSRGAGGAVDGQSAEAWLIDTFQSAHLLSPAREPYYNRLPENGGLERNIATFEAPILSEKNIGDIRDLAKDIRITLPKATTADNTGPYDVELGFLNNKLWLFQIRPFVENDNAKSSEYLKSISPEVDGSKTISLNTTL